MEDQHMLSEWEQSHDGAWLYRLAASGVAVGAIGPYGWTVLNRKALVVGSGNETGRAGQAAADRAAMAMGWKLEGGPVDMPAESARRWGMTDAEQLARIEEAIVGIGDPASSPAERVTEIVATLGRLGAERQRSTPARVADLERAIVALAVRLGER